MLIPCEGGVDQQTQRIKANPGTLRDCLNVEIDTEEGYAPIQGFARYDGRAYPNVGFSLSKYTFGSVSGTFEIGEALLNDAGNRFATFVELDGSNYVLDVFDSTELPGEFDSLSGAVSGATATRGAEVEDSTLTPTTAADWLSLYENLASEQRAAVDPALTPILGAHYFRDALWVVRDADIAIYDVSSWRAGTGVTGNVGGADKGQLLEIYESEGLNTATFLATAVEAINNNTSVVNSEDITVNRTGEQPLHTNISGDDFLPSTFKEVQIWYLAKCTFSAGSMSSIDWTQLWSHATGPVVKVSKVVVDSGSFAGGDAAGTIYLRLNSSGSFDNLATGDYTGSIDGSFTIDSIDQGNGKDYDSGGFESDLGEFSAGKRGAAGQLIKDNGAGWTEVDMGYEVQFDTGTNEPSTVFDLTISQADQDVTATASGWQTATDREGPNDGQSNGWRNTAGSTADADVAAATDTSGDADYAESTPTGNSRPMKSLVLNGFGFNLDDDVTIAGVQVEVRLRNQNNDIEWEECRLVTPEDTESNNKAPDGENLSNTFTTETFGGEGDNWGANLTASKVNSADFGVKLKFYAGSIITSAKVEIDLVRIRVWTRPATERVYFYDGASDVAEADLVYLQRLSGSWASNDAAGVATIRDITNGPVISGLSVYTGAGGTGDLLFTTTSAAELNTLPGLAELDAEESRYQFIDANFYIPDRLRAVYGVSGAGFAFTFNDDYFFRIRTGFENPEDDKPRHIVQHLDRLMLGYGTGAAIFSGAGQPTNFEDTSGTSDSFGSPITGLIRMTGEATAILTLNDVQTLQGSNPATWVKGYVSTESGAIEYTAVDMGVPIYCDIRGISTISATDQYGDFQRGRLSYPVEPWLRPRIQRLLSGANDSQKPVVAVPIRSKSQYLLIFADGYALSMTMTQRGPQFAFRQYKVDGSNLDIIAAGEGVTSSGQDRVFMSHRGSGYVYELNRGLSFDGDAFALEMEFNSTFMDPKHDWTGLLCHVHGNVFNESKLATATISDYIHEVNQDRLLLRSATENYSADELGFFAKARMKTRGNTIALKLSRDNSEVKPGFTIQAYEWAWPRQGKGDR